MTNAKIWGKLERVRISGGIDCAIVKRKLISLGLIYEQRFTGKLLLTADGHNKLNELRLTYGKI